jgi:hypothetical protein
MGFFGAIVSGVKDMAVDAFEKTRDVVSGGVEICSDIASEVKDTTVKAYDEVKENGIGSAMASGVKAFTGQGNFEEAKKQLDILKKKKEAVEQDYKKFYDSALKDIKKHLEDITSVRQKLIADDFSRFSSVASKFAHWKIESELMCELANIKAHTVNVKVSKSELFTIDFDENPIKANLEAFLTFGFTTRSKAAQSLENVKRQECIMKEEEQRLNAEKERLKNVIRALKDTAGYIKKLHEVYGKLLFELEYSVKMIESLHLSVNPVFFNNKLDPYYLPEKHLLCLMGAEKMTRIMHKITKYKIFDSEECKVLDSDVEFVKRDFETCSKIQEKIAA